MDWEDKSSCPLFEGVPGLTALACSYDYMHTKHLGVDQIQFGSVLSLLCYHILPSSPLANLKKCWLHILQSYKELKIVERYRGMKKLTLFTRKGKTPKLKGRAAQLAALGQPLLRLWEASMSPHLEVHKKIRALLKVNVAMETIMQQNPWEIAFEGSDAKDFKKNALAFASCIGSLENTSIRSFFLTCQKCTT